MHISNTNGVLGFGQARTFGIPQAAPVDPRPSVSSENSGAVANRRKSPRFTALQDLAWIGWWTGEEFILVEGTLVNINRSGLLMTMNPSPASGQAVWIRVARGQRVESLKGIVLDSRWMMIKRRFAVHLAFDDRCPADVHDAVARGHAPDQNP